MARGDFLSVEDDRDVIELRADFRRHRQRVDFVNLSAEMETNLEHILHRFRLLYRFSSDKFIRTPIGDTRVQTNRGNESRLFSDKERTYRISSMPLGKLQKAIFNCRFSGTGCSGCW